MPFSFMAMPAEQANSLTGARLSVVASSPVHPTYRYAVQGMHAEACAA